MRRKIITLLCVGMIAIISGCSNPNNNNDNENVQDKISSEDLELSGEEKAAVAACQYVKKDLDDNSTFELKSAKVINDLDGDTKFYLVKLEYTEITSAGESIDSDNFQTIDANYENPWYVLSEVIPQDPYVLQGEDSLNTYLANEKNAEELDCKKIMEHIDDKVN